MAVYRVQGPDGSIIRIEGPDNATEEQLAQAVTAYAGAASTPGTKAPENQGFIANLKETITGSNRRTEETESAPDWATMPELNSFSMASAKTGLGTLLANPSEAVQVIKSNFPGVQTRQDEKGNYFIKSSIDGQEYAMKPGFRPSDVPRAVGAIAAFTPAGRATTLTGAALGAAGTQAVIETSQAATGGEFNPAEVAIAGALGPIVPASVNAVRAVAPPIKSMLQGMRGAAPVAESSGLNSPPVAAPIVQAVEPMAAQELAQTAKKAAEGGIGSARATRVLAGQAAPDQKAVEAAKRLGIDEYLQPDHVTTNQAYREFSQAVKSMPGSEARAAELEGLQNVAKRADDLIEEIGGTTDVSMLDAAVKGRLQGTQRELEATANKLYDQVRKGIPAQSASPGTSALQFVKQRAKDLGGDKNLSPMEKQILAKLSPNKKGVEPTYTLLDDVRKDLGAAARASGPFKDADTGLAKKLYSLLSDDQASTAGKLGMLDTYNAARTAVSVRKGLEDDLASLFGKNIDGSIVNGLSGSVSALAKGDSAKLVKLLKAIPEDMRQNVVASGLNTAFGKSAKNGQLSFTSYANWYEGLIRNKQSYAALMSNLPQSSRKQLSDLYRVSKGISASSKERITTGRINAFRDELKGGDGLMDSVYSLARRAAVGVPLEAATTTVGLPGAGIASGIASALTKGKPNAVKAADELISSTEFLNMAKQAGTPGEKAAALRLVHSKPFSKYAKEIGSPRELSNPEKWVLQSIQAQNQGNK